MGDDAEGPMTDESMQHYMETHFRKTDELLSALAAATAHPKKSPLDGLTTLIAVAGMIFSVANSWGVTSKRIDYLEETMKVTVAKADQVPIINSKMDVMSGLLTEVKAKQAMDSDKVTAIRDTLIEIGLQLKPAKHP